METRTCKNCKQSLVFFAGIWVHNEDDDLSNIFCMSLGEPLQVAEPIPEGVFIIEEEKLR